MSWLKIWERHYEIGVSRILKLKECFESIPKPRAEAYEVHRSFPNDIAPSQSNIPSKEVRKIDPAKRTSSNLP